MLGTVYALENENGTYIGSTFNYDKRMKSHKYNKKTCKAYMITKKPFTTRILLQVEIDKIGLRIYEGEFQRKIKCVNIKIAGRTAEELFRERRLFLREKYSIIS